MKSLRTFGVALSLTGLISCNDTTETAATDSPDTVQLEAPVAKSAEWESLFDGKTLNGWHGFNKKGDSIKNWTIEEGAMVCLGAAKDAHGGDIVSDKEYGNFELTWDWKLTKGANSGVMYHVVEDKKYEAPYQTGPEYQMIDDKDFPEKLEEWQKTGADYAMQTANSTKEVRAVGEWNSSKIVFNNGHVEHWLNGKKVVEFEAWSDAWKKEKETGKWKDYPDYGNAKKGPIALQDHGNKVYFKNIMIREL